MKLREFEKLPDYEKQEVLDSGSVFGMIKFASITMLAVIVLSLGGCPMYNVWQQGLAGEAELRRAEQNRKIAIQEAQALKESAQFKAEAEAIRATGVREANETIADGLGGAEGYLRYLYIDALQSTSCQTIYVPTEAGLPILEAARSLNGEGR